MINRTIAEFADPARFLDGLVSRPRIRGASPKKEREPHKQIYRRDHHSERYLPSFLLNSRPLFQSTSHFTTARPLDLKRLAAQSSGINLLRLHVRGFQPSRARFSLRCGDVVVGTQEKKNTAAYQPR
jgi:hypothetical protein